jgi:putative redox protein
METIKTSYEGELRTVATHIQSGTSLVTDAPLDNQGKGEAFSPTDLLAASLGSCMLTIMGIVAERHHIDMKGTQVKITKIMASGPRRVSEIQVDFEFPQKNYSAEEKNLLENAALTCPVAKSLHPEIKQIISFNY